jgi:hypothetical protein
MASSEARPISTFSGWHGALEDDPAVIYALDRRMKITRCNQAWNRFAIENHGAQLTRDRMAGFLVLNAIPAPLQEFYQTAFDSVVKDGTEFLHLYECSSAGLFREFQMRILPHETGLLIINSLVISRPHDREEHSAHEQYFGQQGIVAMCCHCRRTRRTDDSSQWDWVPAFVEAPPNAVSHGLCKVCLTYHYSRYRTASE